MYRVEYLADLTEPDQVRMVEGNIATLNPEDPFMWRVELYLVSKYMPDFYEASIWKLYSAAQERAKIVKEHHNVITSMEDLERQIASDLAFNVPWKPPNTHHKTTYARSPGIGSGYQRELEEL